MTKQAFIPAEHASDVAHFWEDTDNGAVIHSVQDVGPVLEWNKAAQNHNDGYNQARDMRRVAFIPNIIRDKWLTEEGWDAYRPDLYGDKLIAKLNDPEWRYLRTAPGRLDYKNGVVR